MNAHTQIIPSETTASTLADPLLIAINRHIADTIAFDKKSHSPDVSDEQVDRFCTKQQRYLTKHALGVPAVSVEGAKAALRLLHHELATMYCMNDRAFAFERVEDDHPESVQLIFSLVRSVVSFLDSIAEDDEVATTEKLAGMEFEPWDKDFCDQAAAHFTEDKGARTAVRVALRMMCMSKDALVSNFEGLGPDLGANTAIETTKLLETGAEALSGYSSICNSAYSRMLIVMSALAETTPQETAEEGRAA